MVYPQHRFLAPKEKPEAVQQYQVFQQDSPARVQYSRCLPQLPYQDHHQQLTLQAKMLAFHHQSIEKKSHQTFISNAPEIQNSLYPPLCPPSFPWHRDRPSSSAPPSAAQPSSIWHACSETTPTKAKPWVSMSRIIKANTRNTTRCRINTRWYPPLGLLSIVFFFVRFLFSFTPRSFGKGCKKPL